VNNYSLSHLADHVVLRDLTALASQDRATTAALLAHLAEVDDRKLYLPAAHPSMYLYCVRELRMSEDTAFKRIRVARIARQFPAIFPALADGRLNLSAVVLMAPYLAPKLPLDAANELLAAAAHKANAEIEQLLAERFPKPDVPTVVRAVVPVVATAEVTLRPVAETDFQLAVRPVVPSSEQNESNHMGPLAACAESRARITPLSPGRFSLQLTVNQTTHDLLRCSQSLLGHAVPSGDVSQVIERALGELVEKLEKQKFAKCARSRTGRGTANGRYVPADVRRAVWERDGGQCTFVSDRGHRCEARKRLEFDHIDEVARGGETTVAGMRIRCRAHNQFTAERTFGAGFMREKREEARCKAARAKQKQRAQAKAEALQGLAPNCVRQPTYTASAPS
jgi:5-methylcytosine-specific restriction endonuclease McrA